QEGFYRVVNGSHGSARRFFAGAEYKAAGKTGTAEAFYDGPRDEYKMNSVTNKTFISYAPYDDPQIAVVVVVPWLPSGNTNHENTIVAKRVMDAFIEVGEFRHQPTPEETIEEEDDELLNPEQL